MELLTLHNVIAHGAQVILVVTLGTLAAFLIRVDSAAVRYLYWRTLLAAALLLPLVPFPRGGAETAAAESSTATSATLIGGTALPAAGPATLTAPFEWTVAIAALLAAGVAVRLLWVGTGLASLRRLRGLGESAEGDADVADLQARLHTRADVRFVDALRQPATFGWRRPVVLLPAALREETSSIRAALICHELFHVQRRDWLWVIGEELLLAVFWFNPAMWWVVDRVRLAREEAVDELAVLATGSRRTYVRALLAFAEDAPLAPAPAFAHRRHLFRRITLLSTEAVMSSKRIVSSCAVLALVLLSGSWYAASAFPLNLAEAQARETPGPLEQRANPVSADNPVPKRTDYRAPDYPAEARSAGAEGTVTLRVTLDEAGRVAEVRRTGFSVTVDGVSMHLTNVTPESMEAFMSKAELRTKDGRPADKPAMMRAADAMSEAAAAAVSQWRFEPPAQGPLTFDVRASFKTDGETVASVNRGIVGTPVASRMKYPSNVVRVGGDIKAPTKIKDVRPVYPVEAMRAKVTGMVIIEALIGPDGAVQQAQVLRSIPLLDQAALDAVRQWQFTPTLLNGVPTPVIMTVTVNFTVQ